MLTVVFNILKACEAYKIKATIRKSTIISKLISKMYGKYLKNKQDFDNNYRNEYVIK